MKNKKQKDAQNYNDIFQVLVACRMGEVAIDLNNRFSELIDSVIECKSKGKMVITLSIKPSALNDSGDVAEVILDHAVKLTKAEKKVRASTFFLDEQQRLVREDPAQSALFESEQNDEVKQ